MNCREARDLIQLSLDVSLEKAQSTKVDAHISECASCRKYADLFRGLKGRLNLVAAGELVAASGHVDRFLATADASGRRVAFLPFFGGKPPFVYAAAAAVLMAAAIFIAIAAVAPGRSIAAAVMEAHHLRYDDQLVLDTNANCCHDLTKWFEAQVNRPVNVPDITYPGVVVEGGKLYRHKTGNEMFYITCRVDDQPVSLCLCDGPNWITPKGEAFSNGRRKAVVTYLGDCVMVTWEAGERTHVLVSPFDVDMTMDIFASIK